MSAEFVDLTVTGAQLADQQPSESMALIEFTLSSNAPPGWASAFQGAYKTFQRYEGVQGRRVSLAVAADAAGNEQGITRLVDNVKQAVLAANAAQRRQQEATRQAQADQQAAVTRKQDEAATINDLLQKQFPPG
jgi:hypothetical protein